MMVSPDGAAAVSPENRPMWAPSSRSAGAGSRSLRHNAINDFDFGYGSSLVFREPFAVDKLHSLLPQLIRSLICHADRAQAAEDGCGRELQVFSHWRTQLGKSS